MTGFTEEEVSAAVDRFIRQVVSVPTLSGDMRDIVSARDRVYDLLTTALVLKPDSFFYLVWLARNATLALARDQLEQVDTIIDAAPGVSRTARRIDSTTELTNARAAITDLTAGLSARTVGVRGTLGPGVDRFNRSVDAFMRGALAPNVVVAGEATPTADELRALVRSTWVSAREQHVEILSRVAALMEATTALADVALPQQTIATVVARIGTRLAELEETMASASGVRESRLALLDLLTMRSLLGTVSAFTVPQTVLVPLARDVAEGEFIDSAGDPATLVGAISSPYNYGPSTSLSLSINGGAPTAIPLPGSSRASVRSAALAFPGGPTLPAEIAVVVDFTSAVIVDAATASPPWASGSAAATALGGALGPSVLVEWDAGTSQLVFSSASSGDGSFLRFYSDSADRLAFTDWAFPGQSLEGRGAPIELDVVLGALAETTALARGEAQETFVGTFPGSVTVGDATLDLEVIAGTDGVAADDALTSAATNFQLAGVRAGMAVVVTAPPASVGTYVVAAVEDSRILLETNIPVNSGVVFSIGPDLRTIAVGTRVILAGSAPYAAGYYRVATPGAVSVELDRLVPADAAVTATIFHRAVSLSAVGTTTTSELEANASSGATALGLSTGAPALPALSVFSVDIDPVQRGAKVDDSLRLTSPTSVAYTRPILALDMTSITVAPVPYEAGTWTYEIRSARSEAYDTLVDALDGVAVPDLATVDFAVSRLVRGARYTNEVESALVAYRASLADLISAMEGYSVPVESGVDAIVRMMEEQGFDRALNLLLRLDVRTLFSMDRAGVSYASHLVATSTRAAREVVPVSKLAHGGLVYQELRPLSFQLLSFDRGPEADTEEP